MRRPSVREPLWFEPYSEFREHLTEALNADHEFVEVEWNGDNTVTARLAAAESLRQAIRDGRATQPGARHVVIAHSHGGNVAMYAVGALEARYRPHGICCMATPFLEIDRDHKSIRTLVSTAESNEPRTRLAKAARKAKGLAPDPTQLGKLLPQRASDKMNFIINDIKTNGMDFLGVFIFLNLLLFALETIVQEENFISASRILALPLLVFSAFALWTYIQLYIKSKDPKINPSQLYRALRRRGLARKDTTSYSVLIVRANRDEATWAITSAFIAGQMIRFTQRVNRTIVNLLFYTVIPKVFIVFFISFSLLVQIKLTQEAANPQPTATFKIAETIVILFNHIYISLNLYFLTLCTLLVCSRVMLAPFGIEVAAFSPAISASVHAAPTGLVCRFFVVPNTTPLAPTNDLEGRFVSSA